MRSLMHETELDTQLRDDDLFCKMSEALVQTGLSPHEAWLILSAAAFIGARLQAAHILEVPDHAA